MVLVFAIVFILATCSILYVLFPADCIKKGAKIIKHLYSVRAFKKKRIKV